MPILVKNRSGLEGALKLAKQIDLTAFLLEDNNRFEGRQICITSGCHSIRQIRKDQCIVQLD